MTGWNTSSFKLICEFEGIKCNGCYMEKLFCLNSLYGAWHPLQRMIFDISSRRIFRSFNFWSKNWIFCSYELVLEWRCAFLSSVPRRDDMLFFEMRIRKFRLLSMLNSIEPNVEVDTVSPLSVTWTPPLVVFLPAGLYTRDIGCRHSLALQMR